MYSFYKLIHLLGYGTLISVLIATPILERYMRRSERYEDALRFSEIVSKIGWLSPVGAFLLLISGIAMMDYAAIGIFTFGWLTAKLIIFLVMVVTAVYSAINVGKQRRDLYQQLIDGKDDPKLPGELLRVHNKQTQYTRIQSFFLLMILLFTVYK